MNSHFNKQIFNKSTTHYPQSDNRSCEEKKKFNFGAKKENAICSLR